MELNWVESTHSDNVGWISSGDIETHKSEGNNTKTKRNDCGNNPVLTLILFQRGFKLREKLAHSYIGQPLPTSLYLLPDTPQIKGLHTFIRNKSTLRDEFIFYSKRLIRLVIEYALSLLPFKVNHISCSIGKSDESSFHNNCIRRLRGSTESCIKRFFPCLAGNYGWNPARCVVSR